MRRPGKAFGHVIRSATPKNHALGIKGAHRENAPDIRPNLQAVHEVQRFILLQLVRDSFLDEDFVSAARAVEALSASGGSLSREGFNLRKRFLPAIAAVELEGMTMGLELLHRLAHEDSCTTGVGMRRMEELGNKIRAVTHYRALSKGCRPFTLQKEELRQELAAYLLFWGKQDPLRPLEELADGGEFRALRCAGRAFILYSIWASSLTPGLKTGNTPQLAGGREVGASRSMSDDGVFARPSTSARMTEPKSKRSADFRQQALKEFSKAVVHFPADPLISCCLAQLHASAGDQASAKLVLEVMGRNKNVFSFCLVVVSFNSMLA